jgi:Peptidase inhibitor I78 family
MRALLVAGLAFLAACAEQPQTYRDLDRLGRDYQRETSRPPPTNAEDSCGRARFQHLIGVRADAIDRAALPAQSRVISPDSLVTQDYSASRLNLMVGTDGKIGSLQCF